MSRLLLAMVLFALAQTGREAIVSAQTITNHSHDDLIKLSAEWGRPCEPFQILGNVYYVGAQGVSSFLITSDQGHFLLDTCFEDTVSLIQSNVVKLGFQVRDIKYILNSHAHFDHCGGHAAMKESTGARIVASPEDAKQIAAGGTNDFATFATTLTFKPVSVDLVVSNGQTLKIGSTAITAVFTPGHTRGSTTWTMRVPQQSGTAQVVFFSSVTVLDGFSIRNNPKYPRMEQDLRNTFQKLKAMPCDIFLAPHASFFSLHEKAAKLRSLGKQPPILNQHPFYDPNELREFAAKAEKSFFERLAREENDRAQK